MLKANALYRDGSKLSQPLSSNISRLVKKNLDMDANPAENVTKIAANSCRKNLLQVREDYFHLDVVVIHKKVKIGGHNVYLRTGDYEDGRLGEIFLDMNKEGTLLRSMMNSFAIAVSLGLQYGVPLDEFIDVFTFTRFEPNGMVIGHDNIKNSTSIIDFIFRDLGLNYSNRVDLAHVHPAKEQKEEVMEMDAGGGMHLRAEAPVAMNAASQDLEKIAEARVKGYDGDPCTECGALTLLRNGACMKCDSCGATTGCS